MRSVGLVLTMLVALAATPAARAAETQEAPWAPAWGRIAKLRELLQAWRDAQNSADWAAYQALYDDSFVGVRNAHALEQRQAAGTTLDELEEIQVQRLFAGDPDVARAVFTARSRAGHDEGVRQIVWRRHPSRGWRIVREMLPVAAAAPAFPAAWQAARQPVTGQSATEKSALPGQLLGLAPLWEGDVVLTSSPADEAWAAGRPRFSSSGKMTYYGELSRAVNRRKLPVELRAQLGQRLRLLDSAGRPVCDAKVTGFVLRARVTGAEDIAKVAWDMGAKALVATLGASGARCKGARWARAAALPALTWVTAVEPDAALTARAVAAFNALPAARELAREDSEWRHVPNAAVFDWAPWAEVRLLPGANGAPSLISASLGSHGLCNEPTADLWALWELEGTASGPPALVLRNQPDRFMYVLPTAGVYLDGDKVPTLLFDSFHDHAAGNASGQPQYLETGFVKALDGEYVDFSGLESPNFVCPC